MSYRFVDSFRAGPAGASSWFYNKEIFYEHGHMKLKKLLAM